MKVTTEELVQIKDTKRIKMFHCPTGDVRIELADDEGRIANKLTIPSSNVFSVIRGLLSDRQRFYRKKK